jgi:PAS domain S-box-containing protein
MPDLAFERSLLRTLAEHVPHRIYAKDTEGRFVFANQAVARGMGATDPEQLLGKTDFGFYSNEAAAQYYAEEQDIIRSGEPMLNHEEHVRYSLTSDEAWMLTTKVPLRDDSGRVVGIVGINYDITERKAAEQALRAARLEAEAASRAKSEFLATMSHELRTPLNAVLGYAQMLRADASLSEYQQASLDTIERSGEHLLQLVNDVLDMAKIESGNFELRPVAVHLTDLVQVVGNIVRVKAAEKRLRFSTELDAGLPPLVMVDGRRLGQILINLLANAVKFTDAGSVRLGVRCASLSPSQVAVRFEIADTGPGLQRADMDKLFLRFEQAGNARQRAEGTGLGLAISRELVEAMNGKLVVESEPGVGSVFSFELVLPVEATALTQPRRTAGGDVSGDVPVAPPDAELKTLRELALAGNMREISRYAERLLTLGEQYRGLAERLRVLASGFESKAILELVQRFSNSVP